MEKPQLNEATEIIINEIIEKVRKQTLGKIINLALANKRCRQHTWDFAYELQTGLLDKEE